MATEALTTRPHSATANTANDATTVTIGRNGLSRATLGQLAIVASSISGNRVARSRVFRAYAPSWAAPPVVDISSLPLGVVLRRAQPASSLAFVVLRHSPGRRPAVSWPEYYCERSVYVSDPDEQVVGIDGSAAGVMGGASKLCLSRHHRTHAPGRARSNAPGLKIADLRSRTSAKIDPEAPERGCVLVAQGPFSARLAKLLDEQPLERIERDP